MKYQNTKPEANRPPRENDNFQEERRRKPGKNENISPFFLLSLPGASHHRIVCGGGAPAFLTLKITLGAFPIFDTKNARGAGAGNKKRGGGKGDSRRPGWLFLRGRIYSWEAERARSAVTTSRTSWVRFLGMISTASSSTTTTISFRPTAATATLFCPGEL